MKIFMCLLTVCALLVSMCARADYPNDAVKEQKCKDACYQRYTPAFLQCHAVPQCEAYVQWEAGICVHDCPDAK
jgi:hypothetical protein